MAGSDPYGVAWGKLSARDFTGCQRLASLGSRRPTIAVESRAESGPAGDMKEPEVEGARSVDNLVIQEFLKCIW